MKIWASLALLTAGANLCLAQDARALNEVLAGLALAKERAQAQPVQGHTSVLTLSMAKPTGPSLRPVVSAPIPKAALERSFPLIFSPGPEADWAMAPDQYWVQNPSVEEYFDGRRGLHREGGKLYLVTDHTVVENLSTPTKVGYRIPGPMVRHLIYPDSIGTPYLTVSNQGEWVYDLLLKAPPKQIQKLPNGQRLLTWNLSSSSAGRYTAQVTLDPARGWMLTEARSHYRRNGPNSYQETSDLKVTGVSQVGALWLPTEARATQQVSASKGADVTVTRFTKLTDKASTDLSSRVAKPGEDILDPSGVPVFQISKDGTLTRLHRGAALSEVQMVGLWEKAGIGAAFLGLAVFLVGNRRRK